MTRLRLAGGTMYADKGGYYVSFFDHEAELKRAVEAERERCALLLEEEANFWKVFNGNVAGKFREIAHKVRLAP